MTGSTASAPPPRVGVLDPKPQVPPRLSTPATGGAGYSGPDVSRAWDVLAARHAAFLDLRQDLYMIRLTRFLDDVFAGCRAQRILDVGCGSGHWARHLAALGHSVLALDISHEMLRQASQRLDATRPILLVQMDLGRPGFADRKFQSAIAIGDVLSYLEKPWDVLQSLCRCMDRGALLAGTVLSRRGLAIKFDRLDQTELAGQVRDRGWFVERSAAELGELAHVGQAVPPTPDLIARAYDTGALAAILTQGGWLPQHIWGLNMARTVLKPVTPPHSGTNAEILESWLARQAHWQNHSTNLVFVARLAES